MSDTLPEGDIEVQAVGLNAAGVVVPGVTFTYTTTVGTVSELPDGTVELADTTPGDVTVTATAPNGVSGSATGTVVDSTVASVLVTLAPMPAAEPAPPAQTEPTPAPVATTPAA